jgi:hypothetical protein
MDVTMDIINYYLYGRADLNYDMVGGRKNLKVACKQMSRLYLSNILPIERT